MTCASFSFRSIRSRRGELSGVAPSLPALVAALRMTQKAAGVGFDWPDATGVLDKLDEEIGELRRELGPEGEPRDAAARPAPGPPRPPPRSR